MHFSSHTVIHLENLRKLPVLVWDGRLGVECRVGVFGKFPARHLWRLSRHLLRKESKLFGWPKESAIVSGILGFGNVTIEPFVSRSLQPPTEGIASLNAGPVYSYGSSRHWGQNNNPKQEMAKRGVWLCKQPIWGVRNPHSLQDFQDHILI